MRGNENGANEDQGPGRICVDFLKETAQTSPVENLEFENFGVWKILELENLEFENFGA